MVKISNRYLPLLTYSNKVTFCIKFAHKSGIDTSNECLDVKNLLTNVTQMNEHSNVPTFVHALICMQSMQMLGGLGAYLPENLKIDALRLNLVAFFDSSQLKSNYIND